MRTHREPTFISIGGKSEQGLTASLILSFAVPLDEEHAIHPNHKFVHARDGFLLYTAMRTIRLCMIVHPCAQM
jgi:hypothetical protein